MKQNARQRGAVLVWVVLLMPVLIGLVGLAIDTLYLSRTAQELQIGADAAALAACQMVRVEFDLENFKPVVKIDEAQVAAQYIAGLNRAANASILLELNPDNLADGDIVIGRYNRETKLFSPNLVAPNAVKVRARRNTGSPGGPVNLLFGPIFGVQTADISRTVIAKYGSSSGDGLIVLNPTAVDAFLIQGTQTVLWLTDGALQVNSGHKSALGNNGPATIWSERINVVGGASRQFGQVAFDGEMITDGDSMPDPYADLPAPSYNVGADLGTVTVTGSTVTLTPGYYSGGISMSGANSQITLQPGIYVLDGRGLDIQGGNFIAEGVTLYIIDTTPAGNSIESHLVLGGGGVIQISAPTTGIYAGVAIFQARSNTSDASIAGTSKMKIDGLIYFPNNKLDLAGTGGQVGSQLIVDRIHVFGNGQLIIAYANNDPEAKARSYIVR